MELQADQLVDMYRMMWRIRIFEKEVDVLYRRGIIRGGAHLSVGQEAVAVGSCFALHRDDYITSTHRGHHHCLAKGGDPKLMMAELLGRAPGYCRGKGGSMHIADLDLGILGANGVVDGSMPIAVGAGLTSKLLGLGRVCLCFFGDGGANLGVFHESMNLAALWGLPVIFLCENNAYALSTRVEDTCTVKELACRAAAYNVPGACIDGNDVIAVHDEVRKAAERARSGLGPSLIEAKTYRWEGHNIGDPQVYRTKDEVAGWREKDPIKKCEIELLGLGLLTEETAMAIQDEVKVEIQAAEQFALGSPEPAPETLWEDVYA